MGVVSSGHRLITVRMLKKKERRKTIVSDTRRPKHSHFQKNFKNEWQQINQVLPFPFFHMFKGHINFLQWELVGDKLIQLQLLIHVVIHQFRHILHTLPIWRKGSKLMNHYIVDINKLQEKLFPLSFGYIFCKLYNIPASS